MKATIRQLLWDKNMSIWGEATDKRGKVYLETDKKGAEYARGKYSNVITTRTACEFAPEINKWWVSLA